MESKDIETKQRETVLNYRRHLLSTFKRKKQEELLRIPRTNPHAQISYGLRPADSG